MRRTCPDASEMQCLDALAEAGIQHPEAPELALSTALRRLGALSLASPAAASTLPSAAVPAPPPQPRAPPVNGSAAPA
jgi:hypothetical protein